MILINTPDEPLSHNPSVPADALCVLAPGCIRRNVLFSALSDTTGPLISASMQLTFLFIGPFPISMRIRNLPLQFLTSFAALALVLSGACSSPDADEGDSGKSSNKDDDDDESKDDSDDESTDEDDESTDKDDDDESSSSEDDDNDNDDDESSSEDDDNDDDESSSEDDDNDDDPTSEDDDEDDTSGDDDTTEDDDEDDDNPEECEGLGPNTGNDNFAPSQDPPCGFSPSKVPMFVTLGFDDNSSVEGVNFGAAFADRKNPAGSGQKETFDGAPLAFAFYNTTTYAGSVGSAWAAAYKKGHEMGNHTINHATSETTDKATWSSEMSGCNSTQVGLGIAAEDLFGFRTPFLKTNDAMLQAVEDNGFIYDTSLEEGFQYDHDGTNFLWPYTLDGGSPGNELLVEWGSKQSIEPHPGLWELPVYAVIVPPDEECEKYGVSSGFRDRMKAKQDWFDVEGGKITGFDYNLIDPSMFGMTNDEFAATLMYTLDLRLKGNRAPFLFGTHAKNYGGFQAGIDKFIDYALTKEDVRIVSPKQVLDWIRNPVTLKK